MGYAAFVFCSLCVLGASMLVVWVSFIWGCFKLYLNHLWGNLLVAFAHIEPGEYFYSFLQLLCDHFPNVKK